MGKTHFSMTYTHIQTQIDDTSTSLNWRLQKLKEIYCDELDECCLIDTSRLLIQLNIMRWQVLCDCHSTPMPQMPHLLMHNHWLSRNWDVATSASFVFSYFNRCGYTAEFLWRNQPSSQAAKQPSNKATGVGVPVVLWFYFECPACSLTQLRHHCAIGNCRAFERPNDRAGLEYGIATHGVWCTGYGVRGKHGCFSCDVALPSQIGNYAFRLSDKSPKVSMTGRLSELFLSFYFFTYSPNHFMNPYQIAVRNCLVKFRLFVR